MCAKALVLVILATLPGLAAERIDLPPPAKDAGRLLMQALADRQSTREFSSESLSMPELSGLLWAAFGVNRPESGGRTAPSAWNHQEIDIYVVTADAAYLYRPAEHVLDPVQEGDARPEAGTTDFKKTPPIGLVFVADHGRTERTPVWDKEKYAYMATGFISQNVYLYCASVGLGTVVHDSADKGTLARRLGLRRDQQIIITQAVGRPQ